MLVHRLHVANIYKYRMVTVCKIGTVDVDKIIINMWY